MDKHYYAVVMAGGGGTRLWPLSRQTRPKQMLPLIGDQSLFQISIGRLLELFPPDRIYVVTVEDQAAELQAQCPDIPAENYLLEPLPRGTASVVGLGAVALRHRDPQAVMAVMTADHYIANEPAFRKLLNAAREVALDGYLVTLGITPTFPATGYGYIQRGESLGAYDELEAFRVVRFKEKPDEANARRMLASGSHSWNSGMFVWRVDRIFTELERQMPDLYQRLEEISGAWQGPDRLETIQRAWPGIRPETIDYGVMEGAAQAAVLPAADLGWNDVGSWDSLFEVMAADEQGNIVKDSRHIGLDTRGSLIYGNGDSRLIVTIGVDDLVIVDTGDVLLVCRKEQAQRVRQVVEQLKKSGGELV
jgi:mannose-1-phosphate guanylyltransferase